MKKKVVLCVVLGCLTSALWGCSTEKLSKAVASEIKSEQEDKTEESKKSEEKEDSGNPVLGQEDIDDYEGFEYLYSEVLMTDTQENKETGKKERKKLTVFIPSDDYSNVSGSRGYARAMGISFNIELDPYIRYKSEDYLPEENLAYYVESRYDPFYYVDYKDLVISEPEEIGEDACRMTAEYCYYDKWDDGYSSTFVTYYLKELENGANVLVSIEINENDVTGKTPRLIKELEKFYGFEIDWDKDRAKVKREEYVASGGDNTYSTGYLLFELPENWAEENNSSYDETIYAPEGDSEFAGCMISFYDTYLSAGESFDVNSFIEGQDEVKAQLEETMEAPISEFHMEICDTCMGKAAKLTYVVDDEEYEGRGETYFVSSGYYVYTIQAFQIDDAVDDPFVVLDDIMENGQVRDMGW